MRAIVDSQPPWPRPTPAQVLLFDTLYTERPYARFYVLETIARVPYFCALPRPLLAQLTARKADEPPPCARLLPMFPSFPVGAAPVRDARLVAPLRLPEGASRESETAVGTGGAIVATRPHACPTHTQVHFSESWNELHHLLIMESLGGNTRWVRSGWWSAPLAEVEPDTRPPPSRNRLTGLWPSTRHLPTSG